MFNPSKLTIAGLFLAILILPSFVHAEVLQGVSSSADDTNPAGTRVGQVFTGISDLENIAIYAKRIKTGGSDLTHKFFAVESIQCFEDALKTTPCAASGLDGSAFLQWTRNAVSFTKVSTNIPQNTDRLIFQNATITTPYGSKNYIKLNLVASTVHVFNPSYFYDFVFVPVAPSGFSFGDKFVLYGSNTNTYSYSDFYVQGTTTTLIDMYFGFNIFNETTPIYEENATTPINKNIEILNPTYGTTTASTTFSVQIHYKTPFSLDFRPTTTRHFEIVDAVTGDLDYSYNVTVGANTGENITINATTTTTQGSKYIRAMYLDVNGGVYSEVDEIFFNVATNTYFSTYGLETPDSNTSGLSQIDCGLFEFGCQLQKAIAFLFIPSDNILDKFKNLWQTIAEKKPFGYVTHTINQLEQLNVSGVTAFDLGVIPFMDSIFTPFRTLMAGILWAVFAVYFYRNRLIHLDI